MKTIKTFEMFNVKFDDSNMSYEWNKQIKIDYSKIVKSIKSIEKLNHLDAIEKMIDGFEKKFKKSLTDAKESKELTKDLTNKIKELKDALKLKKKEIEK